MSGGAPTRAVITEIAGHVVGLEMSRVTSIDDLTAGAAGERRLDFVQLWELADAPSRAVRREITVDSAAGSYRLAIGGRASVRSIARDELLPLPTFLEGLGRRAAISGLFVAGSRLGFMVDLDQLGRRAGGGGP